MEKKFKIKGFNYGNDGQLIGQTELEFESAEKMWAMGERWESHNVVVDYYSKNEKGDWEVVILM